MTSPYLIEGARSPEIVVDDMSGRTNTSHAMVLVAPAAVPGAGPAGAPPGAHKQAVLESTALELGAYAPRLAESRAARLGKHPRPPEPARAEAAAEPRLGRPGTTPGR